jgi:beta-galactosidase GanA
MRLTIRLGSIAVVAFTCVATWAAAPQNQPPIPSVVTRDGRFALMVDGAPYLVLGAQVNNSSNWPEPLEHVWSAAEAVGANTVSVPIAWEQIEPVEGRFDFSFLEQLVAAARGNGKRLVLLWFATWKNNGLTTRRRG